MPRAKRETAISKVYHVIIRGINKQDIFLEKQDFYKFIKEVKRTKQKYEYEIYAYSLMNDHVHFVIYDKSEQMSTAIQSLNVSYCLYFNKKYERTGHLFENRFKSHKIENENYLKNTVRYIHKNPENAGLKRYVWTSYYEYINSNDELISYEQVMKIFENNIENFKAFHNIYKKNQDYDKGYEMIRKLKDEEAIKIIKEIINEPNLMNIQNYEKEKKKETIRKIAKIEGITKVQIARILGISKSTIDRMKIK